MEWRELFESWKEKNKSVIVRTEELADSAVKPGERVKKNIAVWFKSGGGVSYRIVHAWVFNPNTDKEEAYWEGGEPVLATAATTATATFRDEAVKMLEELKKKGEIMAYRLDVVDEAAKTAIALTYVKTTEGVKEDRVLIAETEGKISVEKIV